jgi:hypothetical protein
VRATARWASCRLRRSEQTAGATTPSTCTPGTRSASGQAGPEGARALQISSPAAFAELIARAGTPAHLATAETELDPALFMAVTTELGDVVLGPPGTTPADLQTDQGAG